MFESCLSRAVEQPMICSSVLVFCVSEARMIYKRRSWGLEDAYICSKYVTPSCVTLHRDSSVSYLLLRIPEFPRQLNAQIPDDRPVCLQRFRNRNLLHAHHVTIQIQ